MNRQLKQIAEQSGVYFGAASKDYFGEEHPAFVTTTDMDIEKFVELFVQDTVDLLRQEWYTLNNIETQPGESARDIGYRNGRKIEIINLIHKIKERYGVKE